MKASDLRSNQVSPSPNKYQNQEDDFDDLERDFTQYDTLNDSANKSRLQASTRFMQPPSNQSPNNNHLKSLTSSPNQSKLGASITQQIKVQEKQQIVLNPVQQQSRTFNVSLKQTLPRPQDISDEDKKFLLPKLDGQNEKLRTQVTQLMDMLEGYAFKMHFKKSEKYKAQKYEPDEKLKLKDKDLYDKLNQIKHYQKEIKDLRKQLRDSYNIERLIEMEDEIKLKHQRIQELKEEEQALKRVQGEQQVAVESINREGDYEEKIQEMSDEYRKCKKNYRTMYYEQVEKDKQLIEKHDYLVQLDHKVRKMGQQINQFHEQNGNELRKQNSEESTIDNRMLARLRDEIMQAKSTHKQDKLEIKDKLADQDQEIISLEHELKILELQLKEKEQESRLGDLKLKELRRSMKHKQLRPLLDGGTSPTIQRGQILIGAHTNKSHRVIQSNSDLAGSKILKKKLENGRVTYQDVVLTEENIKLHDRKYHANYYSSKIATDINNEGQQNNNNNIGKYPPPQLLQSQTPRIPNGPQQPINTQQLYDSQPKRLGPSPSQPTLMKPVTNDLKGTSAYNDPKITDDTGYNSGTGIYSKPNMMIKKRNS